jgi:thiamine-phosphate pyrophosphorylase
MKINFKLYLITDRKQIFNISLYAAVKRALDGGVKAVQLREKDLGTRELLKQAYKMRELTNKYNAKLFINDRFDIALAVGADGVHLTRDSIPAGAVRRTVRDELMIGVSTHSLKEAQEAEKGGADFVTFGPVFRTRSKVKYGPPVGLDALKQASSRLRIPVFALGGIKVNRIKKVKTAGAFGVSMISEILKADNIRAKAGEVILTLN